MVDQAGARPLCGNGHREGRQWQFGAQMIRHRPADDLAAVEVHDRGQIKPALISLDVGDVGKPDPVRRGGDEVALEQIRGDRKVVTAVGGAHSSWPRHDGPDTVAAHQSLDATAARAAALSPQLCIDARAAISAVGVAVNPFYVVDELTVGDGSRALRARPPSIIASRRDAEQVAHDRHRIVSAAIFDEAESHFGTPAKIAIDFFKMSRSTRSRSFSRCKRAISAAWSADGSRPAPRCSTHRRNTESRTPSSLATDPIERPLD